MNRKWEYEEQLEARRMNFRESSAAESFRLGLLNNGGIGRDKDGRGRWVMDVALPDATSRSPLSFHGRLLSPKGCFLLFKCSYPIIIFPLTSVWNEREDIAECPAYLPYSSRILLPSLCSHRTLQIQETEIALI